MPREHESAAEPVAAEPEVARRAEPGGAGLVGLAQFIQGAAGNRATGQVLGSRVRPLSRKVELRKPGKGSPSGYERRAELVARINSLTIGVLYQLDENDRLTYRVMLPDQLQHFDKKMIEFIDATDVIPLLLVTNAATVTQTYTGDTAAKGATITERLLVDDFEMGWFDIDDLLNSTDESFMMNVIHVLTERLAVADYAGKMGKGTGGTFEGAHKAGIAAETAFLRDLFGDPSIEYVGDWSDRTHFSDYGAIIKGTNRAGFNYESKAEGYRIQHDLQMRTGGDQFGQVVVMKKGSEKRIPVQEFLAERRGKAG